jgi:hypothetical protein
VRGLLIAIVCLLAAACGKRSSSGEEERKPRVDVTLVLDPHGEVAKDAIAISTASPPTSRQMHERSGIHVAIVGVPADGDPIPVLEREVPDAEQAGSNATIVVTTRCLKDLEPGLRKNLLYFWTVAVVVGARCEGNPSAQLGAAALVETGSASRVRITFDHHTRAFLKVEPAP